MPKKFVLATFLLCFSAIGQTQAPVTDAAPPAGLTTPAELFALAANQSDIRSSDSTPFQLKATFTLTNLDGKSTTGEYSEIWISKDRWRRDLSYGSYKESRSCVSGTGYTLVPGKKIDFSVAEMVFNISPHVPSVKDPDKANDGWSLEHDTVNGVPVLKAASTNVNLVRTYAPDIYLFTADKSYPLGNTSSIRSLVYSKFNITLGKTVPYRVLAQYFNSNRNVDFNITSLEAIANPPDDSLIIPGASKEDCPAKRPSGNSTGVISGLLTTRVSPVFPQQARRQGVGGTVVRHITISKEGKVSDIQIVSSPRSDLSGSAIEAVKQYVYKPFLLDGQPVETDGTVSINYAARRQ